MLNTWIDKGLVVDAIGLEGCLVGRPSSIDAIVGAGIMDEESRLDFRGFLRCRLGPVEGYGSGEIGKPGRQEIGDAAAIAEPNHAHFAVALGQTLHDIVGRDKVIAGLGLI